jgi:CRISPR/Cas system-associated exonuclease Cas4 (RecB family)
MDLLQPAERAALHVSVSQIKSYLLCPRRYELRYVLGAQPEHRASNLVLGSAVHEALATWYRRHQAGLAQDAEVVEAVYHDTFAKMAGEGTHLLLDDGETLGDLDAAGLQLVRTFLANAVVPERVLAVESPFHADVVDPQTGEVLEEQLTGYLDAVVQDGERTIVLEHKTAARAWSQDQLDFDLQVSLYQGVTGADAVRLQVLTKTKVPKMLVHELVRTEREQQEAVGVVCQVLKAIRAGAFWPALGWSCKECEFRNRCRG